MILRPSIIFALLFASLQGTAQLTTATNGLSATTNTVSLGGALNNTQTSIDFGNSNGNSSFLFKKGTANYLSILNDGKIGLGTLTPTYRFHISGTVEVNQIIETTDNGYASLALKSNNKKYEWSKRPSSQGDNLELYYHDGTSYKTPAYMAITPDGNTFVQPNSSHGVLRLRTGYSSTASIITDFADHSDPANTSYGFIGLSNHTDWAAPINSFCLVSMKFGTKATKDIMMWANDAPSASNVALTIKANTGNVGIGTSNPYNYRLAVNGDAIFTKAKVKTFATWPDYVFDPSYPLWSLRELEQYIKEYRHLPEVPSAEEMNNNALDLGDNQTLLLKKIEELTLYLLQQNKKIEDLTAEIKVLKSKIR